jgi:uncharacterized protein YrrD
MTTADTSRMTGSTVIDRDGERVGKAADVVYDDRDLQPAWLIVEYGTLRKHHTAVPFDRLYLSDAGDVVVESGRDAVRNAPRIGGAPLLPDDEAALDTYYHGSRR